MARRAVSPSFTLRNLLGGLLVSSALVLAPALAFAWAEEADEVRAGSFHSCMVTSCGDVRCWGRNDYGQAEDRTDRVYVDVGVGQYHTCALDSNGKITCWGDPSTRKLQVPTGTYDELDVGANHACAIRDDATITCWGANGYRQLERPASAEPARDISAGAYHSCAVEQSGSSLICWGRSTHNQSLWIDAAAHLPNGETWRKVSAGGLHSCGISDDEYLYCWGYDGYQAVTGDDPRRSGQQPWATELSTAPGLVYRFPPRKFLEVDAGLWGTCAVYHDPTHGDNSQDKTFCWGHPFSYGRDFEPPRTPPEKVSVGTTHACITTQDGQVECWGDNAFGKATPPVLAGDECSFDVFIPFPEHMPW